MVRSNPLGGKGGLCGFYLKVTSSTHMKGPGRLRYKMLQWALSTAYKYMTDVTVTTENLCEYETQLTYSTIPLRFSSQTNTVVEYVIVAGISYFGLGRLN